MKKKKSKRKKVNKNSHIWAIHIFILTFVLSLSFSVLSQILVDYTHIIIAIILLAIIISINIIFDMIGLAAATCEVQPFLSMASRRIYGAKMAVFLAKNAEKFSNICSDVVGDICGIISGALGAYIVARLVLGSNGSLDSFLVSVLFSSMIAAFTVGGKALGKKIAINHKQDIIFSIAKFLSVFNKR